MEARCRHQPETTNQTKTQTKAQVHDWNPVENQDPSSRPGILTVMSLHCRMPEINLVCACSDLS